MTTNRRRARALLVALEGIDGAGKSTLAVALGRALRRRGYSVRLRREPVDRTIGRLAQEAGARDPWTGAVYFTVDRHLAAARLRDDLARFDVVISDRSLYSTIAYQGSHLTPRDRTRLEQLQRRATVVPDRVLFLDLPPTWLARRLRRRAGARGPLERLRELTRVSRQYRALARRHDWAVLDARLSRRTLARAALATLPVGRPRPRRTARPTKLKRRADPTRDR